MVAEAGGPEPPFRRADSPHTSAYSTPHSAYACQRADSLFQLVAGAIPQILSQAFGFCRIGCLETAMAYPFLPIWMRA
jgi:hypothetical protein